MAKLRGEIKAAILRTLWRNASASGVSLQDALSTWQTSGFEAVKTGRPISSTSGGGYSVTFESPQTGDEMTRGEFLALSEEFFRIYSAAVAALVAAGTEATDDAIFPQMMEDSAFWGASYYTADFSLSSL